MGTGTILTGVLTLVAAVAGVAMAEVCYPDLVCQRCGAIMPGAGHECEGTPGMSGETPEDADALEKFAAASGLDMSAWSADMRKVFARIIQAGSQDDVLAVIDSARLRQALRNWQPCHCLCRHLHPSELGVCDDQGVWPREFGGECGVVELPMCAPCAVAQGITEGMPG